MTTDRLPRQIWRPDFSRFAAGFSPIRKFMTAFDKAPLDPVLGRLGPLEVRLVRTRSELRAAQRLRFVVFYEERSAPNTTGGMIRHGRDIDAFDAICDHLIVIDNATSESGIGRIKPKPKIVGTYRLLRQEVAERHSGFYSQSEFDLTALLARHAGKRFLELGRSCVLPEYRTKRTVELLWHGIWAYTLRHKIDAMIGCASLEGTDIDRLSDQLTLLSRSARAPEEWEVRAHPQHYVVMDRKREGFSERQALAALPPLIKGYLRLGAYIGDGAVVDHAFGTTDVLVVLPVENINPRYITYYGVDARRYAA